MKISFHGWLYLFFGLITCFLYYSVTISPSSHWLLAFLPLGIPLALLAHLVYSLYWLMVRKWTWFFISLLILGMGYTFLGRTYSFNAASTSDAQSISLVNYNVRVFNNYLHLRDPDKEPADFIKWVVDNDSDIKCFQEFYTHPKEKTFNVVPKLKRKCPFHYFKPVSVVDNQYFGLAIFSKYRIVKKGEVKFPRSTLNQAIFADLLIGKDTLRVYNVHLQSMSIDENNLPIDQEGTYQKVKDLAKRIRRGAIYRSGQVNALLEHINACPYKMILSGDLNDTPYSYTYEKLRSKMNNAFEEKGKGFGFTYNGKLFFLRIDNIFSSEQINFLDFRVRRDVMFSDHFPIEATFTF